MSLWLKWKAQFIEAEKPNMVAIKTRLLDQIQGDIFQAECNELAKKLNKLVHDVSFEGMSQELLNKIVEASNINLDSLGNIDFKRKYDSKQKANFALTSSELEAAWRQLKKASEGLTEEQKKIQLKNSESDLSKWQKIVNQLEGSLNNLRGQIFESYLNAIGETIKLYSKDMIESVATNEVDNSDPRTNYSVRNSKQLSGTYYLFGKSFSDCDKQYEILQGWARKGVEVTVRGFSKWNHAYLSSVGKTAYTAGNKNSMQLSITFTYAKKDKIAYAKKKTKKKSKSSTGAKSGTKKTTHKTVTVKSGMTYWSIAQSHNVSVSSLEKMNKWPATKLPVGVKVRYQ